MYLYQFFKEWRKTPQWSFSCCLALLLPLNDLQVEIRGMVDKNILKTQLQTGIIQKPSIDACAKDSGAVSFTLSQGEGECSDDESIAESSQQKVPNYSNTHSNTKRNRGTQTGVFIIALPFTSVHGLSEGNQQTVRKIIICSHIRLSMHTARYYYQT